MLLNCTEVVPRFTLVLFTLTPEAVEDDAAPPDFATGARAFPSPGGVGDKELLELSIFTGITLFSGSIVLPIGSLTQNFRKASKFYYASTTYPTIRITLIDCKDWKSGAKFHNSTRPRRAAHRLPGCCLNLYRLSFRCVAQRLAF